MGMLFLYLFLLGLIIGSYLNVVILRLSRHESPQTGRSHCFGCGKIIRWYDNIPLLSFLILGGRCRYCKAHISWQYPAVELLTGIAFLLAGHLIFARFPSGPALWITLGWLLMTISLMIVIFIYDLRFMEIPVVFLWLANGSTALFLMLYHGFGLSAPALFPHDLWASAWGALAAGGFLGALVYMSKETWMGWGDVWLGTWAGMIVGIALVELYLTVAFVAGAAVGLWFLFGKRKGLKSEIPFAPYLLFAQTVIFLIEWYDPSIFSFLLPWFPATM